MLRYNYTACLVFVYYEIYVLKATSVHLDLLRNFHIFILSVKQVCECVCVCGCEDEHIKCLRRFCNYLRPIECNIPVGRDNSADISTRYGLDTPGIESRLGRVYPHPSRPALGPIQRPIHWLPGHFPRGKPAGVFAFTTHPHLVPRLKKV